jgi:hypothetical protein
MALSNAVQAGEYDGGAALAMTLVPMDVITRDFDAAVKTTSESRSGLVEAAKKRAALADELSKWRPFEGMEAGEQKIVAAYLKASVESNRTRAQAFQALARASRANLIDSYNAFVQLQNRSEKERRIADDIEKSALASR